MDIERINMKLLNLAGAIIFGLATPLLTQTLAPTVAVAASNRPEGTFRDAEWQVSLSRQNNSYHYRGVNIETNTSIELAGAKVSGTSQRRIYTWNNEGTKYQVVWQARDPNFVRVKVVSSRGRTILNRLLPRISEEGGM
jgi:hypothetical protein